MIRRTLARAAEQALDSARSRIALRDATRVGRGVRVFGWPRVANEGELTIGDRVSIVSRPSAVELLVAPGASVLIGDRALVESGAVIRARGRICIGAGARIGAACILDDEALDPDMKEISVGDGAWVEDGEVLLGGARVSAGAFVANRMRRNGSAAPSHSAKVLGAEDAELFDVDPFEVDRRIRAVLGRLVGVANLDQTTDLNHVKGWDSLAALRVLVALEKEFAIVLPHQLFAQHRSLESVMPVILASVARRPEAG